MATSTSTFKAKGAGVTNAFATIISAGAGVTTMIHSLIIANKTAAAITVDVRYRDNSAATDYYLVKAAPIEVGGALIIAGDNNKLILEQNDYIEAQSSVVTGGDASVSYVEMA